MQLCALPDHVLVYGGGAGIHSSFTRVSVASPSRFTLVYCTQLQYPENILSIIYYTALLYCNMLSCVKVEMACPYLSKRVTVASPSPYLVNYYIIYYITVSYIYIIYTELYFAVFYRRWKWHSHPFHKGDCCIPISLYNIVHMRTQYTLT